MANLNKITIIVCVTVGTFVLIGIVVGILIGLNVIKLPPKATDSSTKVAPAPTPATESPTVPAPAPPAPAPTPTPPTVATNYTLTDFVDRGCWRMKDPLLPTIDSIGGVEMPLGQLFVYKDMYIRNRLDFMNQNGYDTIAFYRDDLKGDRIRLGKYGTVNDGITYKYDKYGPGIACGIDFWHSDDMSYKVFSVVAPTYVAPPPPPPSSIPAPPPVSGPVISKEPYFLA